MLNKIKEILNEIINLDFSGMAAEMAFHFTFALFPFAILRLLHN